MAGTSANEEDGLELGLGLSLCGGGSGKAKGSPWGEYGRILTAKDFPNGFSSATKKRNAAESVSPPPESASPAGATTNVSQVVGWPPLRTYRMNNLSTSQTKTPNAGEDKEDKSKEAGKKKVNNGGHGNGKADHVTGTAEIKGNLGFVKVNIDGLPIGRKVDLNAHVCYETLAQAIEDMFFGPTKNISSICADKEKAKRPSKLLDGSSEFVLTYEDKEGDWMLVGDVPWRMFLSTVKRLRIMRTSEANGLAPRFQEQTDRRRSKPI